MISTRKSNNFLIANQINTFKKCVIGRLLRVVAGCVRAWGGVGGAWIMSVSALSV